MKNQIVATILVILFNQFVDAQPVKSHALDEKSPSKVAPERKPLAQADMPKLGTPSSKTTRRSELSMEVVSAKMNAPLSNSQSAMRGQDRGGGNAVGNVLFDFAEAGLRFEVEELAIYPKLRAVLNVLKATSPQLWLDITTAIKDSRWTFDNHPLTNENCLNASLSGLSKTVVACQDQLEIRVYKPWFDSSKVRDKSKIGLLLHEAIRRIGYVDPFVTQVTRDIMDLFEGRQNEAAFIESINSYAGWGRGRVLPKRQFCGLIYEAEAIVRDYPRTASMDFGRIASRSSDPYIADQLFELAIADRDKGPDEKSRLGLIRVRELAENYGCRGDDS